MKRSIRVVTSILAAAAVLPIGFTVAQADNGNHYGSDKQKLQHSQNAQLKRNDHEGNGKHDKHTDGETKNQRHNQNAQVTRNDHDRDDNNGKHADGEHHNQRHNQNAQLTRNDHDRDDNNGKHEHVGWDKHLGKPTGDWTTHHPTAVPEPASLVLLGAGIAGIGFLRRMSRKA